ncbi:hypothetical protein [Zavarzinella formosa]|uniref:hypothetical protein n=1 Tax=Zavarzinella formosa TaxID=360055 RepID=UPI000317511C|nr:hypothetical protein [Zavarzinella formosa]
MIRPLLIALLFALPALAEDDPIRATLNEAKKKYDLGIRTMNAKVSEAFQTRDDKIRNSAKTSTALLEILKGERQRFTDYRELPAWAPTALVTQQKQLLTECEEAHTKAIKNYLKDKQDDAAAKVDKELDELWASTWLQMDYKEARIKDGYIRIPREKGIATKTTFTGPIEISLIARTEDENIRINAYNGSVVIFNWEGNRKELRVCRPDGNPNNLESGSLVTAKLTPLEPNKWYTLRWQIQSKGMAVYCNDRLVWSEKKAYKTEDMSSKIIIKAATSIVDVKELKIKSLVPLD